MGFKLLQLLLAVVAACRCSGDQEQHRADIDLYREYGGSLDLQDAFDVFYSEPCKSMRKVKLLLDVFNKNCPNITYILPQMAQQRRHVFIAVEGTHRETKLIITKMLARRLRGRARFSPPYFLVNTGHKYSDSRTMSRAYYCLGYYATAYSAALVLPHQPVVTGGYWLDQLAFGVVAAFTESLPLADSPLYTWPRDLLVPDVVFFLNLPSHNLKNTFTEHDPLSFRSRLIQFYRSWPREPALVEINNTNVHRDVIRMLCKHVELKLGYMKHLEPRVAPARYTRPPDTLY